MNAEFEKIKCTDFIVNRVLEAGGSLEDCICYLSKHNAELVEKVIELEMLVPKKIRISPEKVMIWQCPDELIPETSL